MTQIDPKTLEEFRYVKARILQQRLASDKFWLEIQWLHKIYGQMLRNRRKVQSLARRSERTPVSFVARIDRTGNWLRVPEGLSSFQAKEFIRTANTVIDFFASGREISDLDGKQLFKQLQSLSSRQRGRKTLRIYFDARELQQKNPSMKMHDICKKLNREYKDMTPEKRRAEREKIRNGMRRLKLVPASA